jgi:glycosyltransferase involved in cell wall biosynthesis
MNMVPFSAPFTETEAHRPVHVLDLDEFDGRAQERFAQLCLRNGEGLRAAELSIDAGKWIALTRECVSRFDRVLVCAGAEVEKLRDARIEGYFDVLQNAYEISGQGGDGDGSHRFDFVFVGVFGHHPNVDAMRFFCTEIWPTICEAADSPPTLAIVGHNPPDEIRQLDEVAGVTVTGFVPETAPYYRNSQVAIVPLRAGGGTRIKILEAFALGVPVVSTTIGAEGLDVESGRHLLIADTPDEFAAACLRLLHDAELRERLVQSATDLFRRTHSVPVVKENIRRTYRELVHGT